MLWEGSYNDFSSKKDPASGGFAPDPHKGLFPLDLQGTFAPLTIYPGAAPAQTLTGL